MSERTTRIEVTYCSHFLDKTFYTFSDGSTGTWHSVRIALGKWGYGPEHSLTEEQREAALRYHAGKRGEIL